MKTKLTEAAKAKAAQAMEPTNEVDGNGKKKKNGGSGFQVGKRKLKTKLTEAAKAKAAQAMELDK
ncbi:hypothetical protein F3Y22_tig00110361pilonHSYRG00014 [Hibiscus syriacus]|uniref:Uncharacterized protein n=1 Tax=Hibiscus syriacus TaxID=106335 RepID=A0A6A3ATK4_HIBSY|nr:hypothetical protein F3Y22_tig00110361pilonHSYRG00014 [Hibiscus syriacus]